jgi:hypothetical protein
MGTTTFSGPIKAGTIRNTTGTIVGSDIANVGTVVSTQSMSTTQAAQFTSAATTIVIPANSTILRLSVAVTVAGTGTATTGGFGWDNNDAAVSVVDPDALTGATQVQTNARGLVGSITPGATVGRVENWINTGTTDKRILFTPANSGDGEYTIIVEYAHTHKL